MTKLVWHHQLFDMASRMCSRTHKNNKKVLKSSGGEHCGLRDDRYLAENMLWLDECGSASIIVLRTTFLANSIRSDKISSCSKEKPSI